MNRTTPIVCNEPYHLYNRGNNRQVIFRRPSDYAAFLEKLRQTATKRCVSIIAYVLMPNHYHLLVIQRRGGSIPDMMEALGTSTAKRFNLKYAHVGHLFQGPYKYTLVETKDGVKQVARYIHLNPVRAGFVRTPEDWEWSDFRQHLEAETAQRRCTESDAVLPRNYVRFVRTGACDLEKLRKALFSAEAGKHP